MATKATVSDIHPVSEELKDFRALQARLLAGAAERIRAHVECAKQLGLIDDQGNLLFTDLPEDITPGAPRPSGTSHKSRVFRRDAHMSY